MPRREDWKDKDAEEVLFDAKNGANKDCCNRMITRQDREPRRVECVREEAAWRAIDVGEAARTK